MRSGAEALRRRHSGFWCTVTAVVAIALFITLLTCTAGFSDVTFIRWGSGGEPVSTAPTNQGDYDTLQVVPDGYGGAILAWKDNRNDGGDIYAQRLDSNGNRLWINNTEPGQELNGIPVCGYSGEQGTSQVYENHREQGLRMASDGNHGAIITWIDYRNDPYGNLFAQKIDENGVRLWDNDPGEGEDLDGIPICTAEYAQETPEIATDYVDSSPTGGAVIVWEDYRGTSNQWSHVYAQKIDAGGNIIWEPDGTLVATVADQSIPPDLFHQLEWPLITSDYMGGAVIAWEWIKDGSVWTTERYLRRQRVTYDGELLWETNPNEPEGILVAYDPQWSQEYNYQIVSDATNPGGAIISWSDWTKTDYPVVAVKFLADGSVAPGWSASGNPATKASRCAWHLPQMVSDGLGGAVIAWQYGYSDSDIYANRLNSDGLPWDDPENPAGVPVCVYTRQQETPRIASDGAHGAIIAWEDSRNSPNVDIYTQRISSDGIAKWTPNGVLACDDPNLQQNQEIACVGRGNAITCWQDGRELATNGLDIYAQRVRGLTIDGVYPNNGVRDTVATVTVYGEGFLPGVAITLEQGTTVISAGVVSVTNTEVSITLDLIGQPLGFYDVIGENPDGQSDKLENGFRVREPCGKGAGTSLLVFGVLVGLLALIPYRRR